MENFEGIVYKEYFDPILTIDFNKVSNAKDLVPSEEGKLSVHIKDDKKFTNFFIGKNLIGKKLNIQVQSQNENSQDSEYTLNYIEIVNETDIKYCFDHDFTNKTEKAAILVPVKWNLDLKFGDKYAILFSEVTN